MAEVNRDIKYINRDFSDIRAKLIEFSKTYYPNTYNDFSPTSPGMMFMEMSAYVGDIMSFYLDNQLGETYTQLARQSNNLYELAYMFGYKPKATSAAQTEIELYQQVPSKLVSGEYIPDMDYALTIGENSSIASSLNSDVNFLLQDTCDFSVSSSQDPTEVSIYQTTNNIPLYYLLKKTRKIISSTIKSQEFNFGDPIPFQTININESNIIKILDITDSEGNTWEEVDCLGQETVFNSIKNTNINDPNSGKDVPYLLKLKKAPYRFATRCTSLNNLQIQFGAGSPNDTVEEIIPNPNNVGIGLPFKKDKLSVAYSPTNFLFTNTYGISPTNTTLTVRYLVGGGIESNVPSNAISNLSGVTAQFSNFNSLNATTANYVIDSLSINNPLPSTGGGDGDTLEEIRQNTMAAAFAQHRSVTPNDYLIRALSMPSDFGSVTKAYIEKPKLTDNQISTIETLCLYVLSQNNQGKLDYASNILKENLRTYLSEYRMIGDSIEIKDGYIINFKIDFEIIVGPNHNNSEVLIECISSLASYFDTQNFQFNQPILIKDVFILLDKVKGVQTVKNVKFSNKVGGNYSQFAYDMDAATQNQVIYPSLDPSVFELRYPNEDIKGRVVPL